MKFVRRSVCEKAAWLGLALDEAANQSVKTGRISSAGSRLAAWLVPTDEELMIARHSVRPLAAA